MSAWVGGWIGMDRWDCNGWMDGIVMDGWLDGRDCNGWMGL